WVDALSPVFLFMEPAQIANATAAIDQLLCYLRRIVEQRSHTPADDLMTSLLRAEHDGDRLTRDETVTMVANLLVGGHDTTASQIGCTLLTLLSQRNAMAELRSKPFLLAALVSETIRFEPSIAGAPRTVFEPIEVCGTLRPAGAVVMCSFLTANRDPDVWQDADSFVPQRFASPSAPRLLSFGGGPHYCLGAALARMTLEEVVRGVTELAPTLAADADDIEWVQSLGRSPARLPVAV
ncbi:MAG: cytochrome P450, partial [Proteobacteria bacterium]|nr:cytochrome P450 [Pseudomonadota bacterium]